MKLTDFFIGSRQLFGFLAPGVLWLFAFYLPVATKPVTSLISQAGLPGTLVFLAVALVVGTAFESLSFRVAVRLSAAMRGERVSGERNDSDFFPLSISSDLVHRCREIAARQSGSLGYVETMTDREFSQYCKWRVIGSSDKYGARLGEYEAEINLLAMLPLPLSLFALSITVFGLGGGSLPMWPSLANVLISVTALMLAGFLLLRLHPLRREEAEWWFRFFLMTAEKSAEINQPPNPVLGATAGGKRTSE